MKGSLLKQHHDVHITINGVDIDWNLESGAMNFLGISSTLFWNDPSLLNMFKPLVDEMGKEMFNLQVAHSSSLGTEEDYHAMVTQLGDTFEEGFLNWGKAVSGAGWGIFEMPRFDPKNVRAKVVVHNPWELRMQARLDPEERWGCPFIQGKIIGIFNQALHQTCWANQNYEVDGEHSRVEFEIYPHEATIEDKINELRSRMEQEKILNLKREIEQAILEKNQALKDQKRLNRELEKQKTLYESFLNLSSDGVFIMSPVDGSLYQYSNQVQMLLGYDDEEMKRLNVLDWDKALPSIEAFQEIIATQNEIPRYLERVHTRKDGSTYHAGITSVKVIIDDREFIYAAVRDISEQIKTKEAMRRAKEQAEKASQVKTEFLANMSHEIRTPMNAVIGMTKLALDTGLNDEQRSYVEKAHIAAENLLGIINDILDFSKLEAGKLQLSNTHFELKDVIRQTLQLISIDAHEKGLKVRVKIDDDVPHVYFADALRLGQVLTNLASNAVKFSHEGGNVTLSVSLAEAYESDVLVRFSVQDDGIGISKENQKKLFLSFSQAESSTNRKFGGTGLGLAICRKITELMGGEIRVESEEGAGSIFSFTARMQRSDRETVISSTRESEKAMDRAVEQLRGARILLVEDNKMNQELAEELLRRNGLKVTIADNGLEALEHLETETFDGVLMDCQMPVMDGYEATRKIRDDARYESLPVIAMTANVMETDRKKALASGMNDYIPKPVDPADMFIIMARWIRR
jgi:PAS domain S-box-containing protein